MKALNTLAIAALTLATPVAADQKQDDDYLHYQTCISILWLFDEFYPLTGLPYTDEIRAKHSVLYDKLLQKYPGSTLKSYAQQIIRIYGFIDLAKDLDMNSEQARRYQLEEVGC